MNDALFSTSNGFNEFIQSGLVKKLQNEVPGLFKHYFFGFQGLKSEISFIKEYHYYLSNSNKLLK